MSKKEKLELELKFQIQQGETLERKINIWYKIIFIVLIGIVSVHVTFLNKKYKDEKKTFSQEVERIKNKYINVDINSSEDNMEDSVNRNPNGHKVFIKYLDEQQKMYNESTDNVIYYTYKFAYIILLLLILPMIYSYFEMRTIESNIKKLQQDLLDKV